MTFHHPLDMNIKRCFAGALALAGLLGASPAEALTKMREGFASMVVTDGTSLMPRNRITVGHAGDEVVYWIQWKEPVPKSSLRCVITGPDTNLDDTENFAEAEGEGYSICGMQADDADAGTFHFTQYLDGEKVGEASILVEKQSFFSDLSFRKKWKYMMGALAAIILAVYWIRRKMTGDTRALKEILGGEAPAAAAVRDAIVIGSRANPAGAPAAAPATANSKAKDGPDLKKLGAQFEYYMGQPDKSQGLDAGRRYLAALIAAKDDGGAIKVLKQCAAADPAFRLSNPDDVLPLAKAARAAGDSQAAVAAVRGFDKAFPGHALIPDVFLFTAKLLAEDLRNTEMAKKILEHILQKYPGHYLAQEARRYLQSMPAP
jgi:hypothetical protein